MRTKQVYQLDQNGVFIGLETSFESPLEPGVFLIPAGCVEIEPPSFKEGQYAQWINSKWVIKDIPIPTPEEVETQRVLTEEELLIQAEEELIQSELRKLAIERLGNKLTVVKE